MTSYLVIVNPTSGMGTARGRAETLARHLSGSASVQVVETAARGSATELAREGVREHDRIVAVGGDGTLNEVLTGLVGLERNAADLPVLGFLPSGTANAATRAFGFASDPLAAARSLPEAPVRCVDLGLARFADGVERPFLLWCGAGIDAVVIDVLNRSRTGHMGLRGLMWNAPRIVRALATYPAPEIEVAADGAPARKGARSVVVTNVADIAFGATVVAAADPFDRRLDVVALDAASLPRLLGLTARMLASELRGAGGTHHDLVERIHLASTGDVPVQLDGEPAGRLPVSVSVRAGAVRLLLTGGAERV